jgi:eukaryotic-like serine/threonine-protein kinase
MTDDDRFLQYNGSFRLVRKIAVGGMATVYEAEQLGPAGFAKRIALKVIHPQYAKQREWLQLFIDEAKLSANLMHGNVVQIYQLGEVAGEFFIAMEFIQGPTLRNVIDRHWELGVPIPAHLAAYVASRVCRALDFAHNFVAPDKRRLDIVHRDVSPGNIMASWDGHIKLADFGIAKARTSIDPAAGRQMLMGKKHYMSPEQMLGLSVDARSDIFAMGVVLYELLALEPLFTEDVTQLAIDEVAVHPTPSIRARIPGVPAELERIIQAALDKDPSRRPSAASMGRDLDRWCEAQRVSGSPDMLQEHLAKMFPSTYQPSRDGDRTSFSNLKRSAKRAVPTHGSASSSLSGGSRLLAKLFGR